MRDPLRGGFIHMPWLIQNVLVAVLLTGCASSAKVNPSLSVTRDQAKIDIERMHDDPVALTRPVVVITGWADPGFLESDIKQWLDPAIDGQVIYVNIAWTRDMSACLARVEQAMRKAELWTGEGKDQFVTEVDVVAFSLGGLVARYAAVPSETRDEKDQDVAALPVSRLITISSPHQGAVRAPFAALDPLVRDMVAGSDRLKQLDEALSTASYELICYTRLGDTVVGTSRTFPEGRGVYWVDRHGWETAHNGAASDPRIVSDVLRRLRGEETWSTHPPADLPDSP